MRSLVVAAALGLTAAFAAGQDAAPLLTAHGTVEKADKDALTVRPRGADGKFQKGVSLKVTGTSKVTVLTPQTRDGKVVFTQREAAAQDLAPGQAVAVIYAEAGKDGPVLLSAVAHPAGK